MKTFVSSLVALFCGVVFGIGALVSGMANPAKVLNFFDILGTWDPSLAFVMGGALAVTFIGYRLAFARTKPVAAAEFLLPTKQDIDRPLVVGAVVFGIGWGLSGLCPGPALAAVPIGGDSVVTFVIAMAVGIAAARVTERMTPAAASG